MTPTVNGRDYPQTKHAPTKTRVGKDEKSAKIMITLNGAHTYTREDFVINALESAGEEGVYINELLRG